MPKPTAYELERLENIRRNEELMKSLGIFQPAIAPAPKRPNTVTKKRPRSSLPLTSTAPQPRRKSARLSALEPSSSRTRSPEPTLNSDPIDFLTSPSRSRKAVTLRKLDGPRLPFGAGSGSGSGTQEEGAWETWTASQPTRGANGGLRFEGELGLCFCPNMTPEEVLRAGSFGGTFFQEHYSTILERTLPSADYAFLPAAWISGLLRFKFLASRNYDPNVNKYGVKAGQPLREWEAAGWIRPLDPRGWFQWYCRYYMGRRTGDDERQIRRWQGVAGVSGRFKRALVKKIAEANARWDDVAVAPVLRQTLQHWGYRLTEADYNAYF